MSDHLAQQMYDNAAREQKLRYDLEMARGMTNASAEEVARLNALSAPIRRFEPTFNGIMVNYDGERPVVGLSLMPDAPAGLKDRISRDALRLVESYRAG